MDNFKASGYLGLWYQVARTPNPFQKQCDDNAMAYYSQQLPGGEDPKSRNGFRPLVAPGAQPVHLRVANSCVKENGKRTVMYGEAKQLEPGVGAFNVKFDQVPDIFQMGNEANYRVLYTDYKQVAVVSNQNGQQVWILSRTPNMDADAWNTAIQVLRQRNIPIDKLKLTLNHQVTSSP